MQIGSHHPSIFLLVVVSHLISATLVSAQAGKAELTGEVRDQSGALVTGSRVILTEVATSQTHSSIVTDSGDYTITSLKPGTYNVAVEADGFKRFLREGVLLATGERVRLDVVLEPGTVSETVTVRQDASLLRTETGSRAGNSKSQDCRHTVEWQKFPVAGYIVGWGCSTTTHDGWTILSSHQRRPAPHE